MAEPDTAWGKLLLLRKVDVCVDHTDIGAEALSAAAFAIVEDFCEHLEAKIEASRSPVRGAVELRLVPTDKMLALLKQPGLFRLEIEASGLPWPEVSEWPQR